MALAYVMVFGGGFALGAASVALLVLLTMYAGDP
jgi:hypothetical protein